MTRRLIGNRATEKDIRRWLSDNGYYGDSARFNEVELHAIQRPGWLQVFRFTVAAKAESGTWTTLYGAIRDDERYRDQSVEAFLTPSEQQVQLEQWSSGMIRSKKGDTEDRQARRPWHWSQWLLLGGFLALCGLLGIAAMMSQS